MPLPFDLTLTVSNVDVLSQLASRFIGEFEKRLSPDGPLDVNLVLHKTRSGFTDPPAGCPRPMVLAKQDGARTNLHLSGPDLVGIPVTAFQGGLDLELATVVLGRRKSDFQFNFRREILPLINVSGTAKQVIRYLVHHLEAVVKQLKAVELVLDMAHGLPLCAYYYMLISPSNEDKENYRNLVPHHWTRAIFISKKCKEHAAIVFLAQQGIFAELEAYWWACHDYILPEDKHLLEELGHISSQSNPKRFSKRVVVLFETVKSNLLMVLGGATTQP
ncbi:MAG: hypothetical protein HN366_03905 [Deltaproteobacteria bacterium]|jgi:hypothetical protein|nr:hypothetical protein [Deltaproteobacteria bacterium]